MKAMDPALLVRFNKFITLLDKGAPSTELEEAGDDLAEPSKMHAGNRIPAEIVVFDEVRKLTVAVGGTEPVGIRLQVEGRPPLPPVDPN